MQMILMLPAGTEKLLLLPVCKGVWCHSVCAKKPHSPSCKMEHKSRSLNISCDSIRLKSVSGTEEVEEKSRATFFTKRSILRKKMCQSDLTMLRVPTYREFFQFILSAKVEMCDDGGSKRNHICEWHDGDTSKEQGSKQCFW